MSQTMSQAYRRPPLEGILPDILAFVLALATMWLLAWKTSDLVWSLWLCGLVFGHIPVLALCVLVMIETIKAIFRKPSIRNMLSLIFLPIGLLVFCFPLWIYCVFHAAHAGFLLTFFPIESLSFDSFMTQWGSPIQLWETVVRHVLPAYGLFLVPALIAERRQVFGVVIRYVKLLRDGEESGLKGLTGRKTKKPGRAKETKDHGESEEESDPFVLGFKSIIRMHLMIFFFAFFHWVNLESFVVFAIVYAVYFFPWKQFTGAQEKESEPGTAG